jgi:hypothetical protein
MRIRFGHDTCLAIGCKGSHTRLGYITTYHVVLNSDSLHSQDAWGPLRSVPLTSHRSRLSRFDANRHSGGVEGLEGACNIPNFLTGGAFLLAPVSIQTLCQVNDVIHGKIYQKVC